MKRHSHNADDDVADNRPDPLDDVHEGEDDIVSTAATVAVVGAGVLIFEAALLPGMLLGVATMLVPKALPRIGAAMNPLMRSTIKGAYVAGQKAREFVAEAREHVHDIVAEVDAEADKKTSAASPSA